MENIQTVFEGLHTIESVKRMYRRYAQIYHPDHGGSEDDMKLLNQAYLQALRSMDGNTIHGDNGKDYTYRYDDSIEREILQKLYDTLAVAPKHWNIMLIGKWIWISRTKKEDRDIFRKHNLKYRWHGKKGMWYWRPAKAKSWNRNGKGNLIHMMIRYGYTPVNSENVSCVPDIRN